ncbi:FUSC family protein [Marinilongibacter aquaticus]|uniref:FUSC family protein n=1 Tax=Marinilongibacter aquaticus TaxID=2975157 RepID=UPI0021BD6CB0|nr:FUSC family protein [Marinilongibacter aquaticus]UBM59635.1 FUSC family protein [Marinilongibacter aquaticus]
MSWKEKIQREFALLFTLQSSNRKWQTPLLTAICMGVPLLTGFYWGNLKSGLIACLSGFIILYIPNKGSITNKITTVLVCSFGFMIAFAIGQLFSFNRVSAVITLGLFTTLLHWIMLYYKTAPPRSFFFILIAAISICQPFDLSSLPLKIGFLGLGTMFSCLWALLFVLGPTLKGQPVRANPVVSVLEKNTYADFWEAIILGVFISLALALGYLLEMSNPYWIPVSCAAVMQGASLYHIWQRTIHRILGTFLGLGLCWILLTLTQDTLVICMFVVILQLIVEILVVRNYALAVIFITPLAILLSEAASPIVNSPNTLIALRFSDILVGSILGAAGGWVLYKEKLRYATIRGLKKIGEGLENRYN